ncbi:MAG: hypothetical protein IBX50_20380 [Marinospirillum sp.]|uniref:hypothetical protein n=1 Tax=Marinospirillum sp. TaxID=2183934 RepID=UPI001A0B0CD5|nr:hypothetical protein [Marinospirillum sp.]MBE0509042.1 hypothetical protein [Marinospirillum sp.]
MKEFFAVEFDPGSAEFKIKETLVTCVHKAPCRLRRFSSLIIRDQFVSGKPRNRYSIDYYQAQRLGLL